MSKDPILGKVIKSHTMLELDKSPSVFHELVKAIIYQQISIKAAESIHNRFIAFIGSAHFLPEDILPYSPIQLKEAGLSSQKANYIINIANYFMTQSFDDDEWQKFSDDEIIKKLISIKGVGEWTAQMMLMFQLDRPDVLPVKDLAIQVVMKKLYNIDLEKKALITEMERIGEAWSPYKSYASKYLWAWKRAN